MKIKDLGNGNYSTFPITDDMIEVDDILDWIEKNTPQNIKNQKRIDELKKLLSDSDYKAIKFFEGKLTETEFAPIRQQRDEWRAEINRLEQQ